ncbi:PKD domain-containing protein [bacterium]|nr:MAG: PKD domain-containing protein [bacterium]
MNHFRMGMRGLLWLMLLVFVRPCFASKWTEGAKTVLYIRVDFPDYEGEPISEEEVVEGFKDANQFFMDNSNGRTSLKVTVTPVLRQPETLEYYRGTNYNEEIINDARDAARGAGFDTDKYDLDIVSFRRNDGSVGGVGAIGGKGLRLFSEKSMRITVHELGHNFGLPHSGLWISNDGSILGEGRLDEYSNPFDWMGGGGGIMTSHFNARFKNLLGWIPDADIVTPTTNGMYHINAHDFRDAQGVRALKIARNGDTNYWIEYRQCITDQAYPMNGVQILQGHNNNNDATLLDMTPGSPHAGWDGSLVVGRTFSDWEAGLHITTVNKDDTGHGGINVLVNRGEFADNQPPQLTLRASAPTSTIGAVTSFTAVATDPDGDALHYSWDFGDGAFAGGSATASETWPGVGDYIVRCTVSDGKGGTANASVIIRVKFAISTLKMLPGLQVKGRITCGGAPLQDVRVQAGEQQALTDSDGTYTLVNLPPGLYQVSASKMGYEFKLPVPRSVSVKADTKAVDFEALAQEKAKPQIHIFPATAGKAMEIEGDAWDNPNGSGIARVEIFIQRGEDYWTGNGWVKARTPLIVPLSGVKWRYATNIPAEQADNLQISASSTDRAGNSSDVATRP